MDYGLYTLRLAVHTHAITSHAIPLLIRTQGDLVIEVTDGTAEYTAARWNGQSLSSGQLAKVYRFTDLDGSQPEAWRYLSEVQDAGKPAGVTGYR